MKEIRIGKQTWSAENLALTVDRDGNELVLGKDYFYPNGKEELVEKYGLLYTWEAAMRVVPAGWHLPSDDEWNELAGYAESRWPGAPAKALASTEGWKKSDVPAAIGNKPSDNNASGFSAVPAGLWYRRFTDASLSAYFWSSTESSSLDAWNRGLHYDNAGVGMGYSNKDFGFSVRCLRDEEPAAKEPAEPSEFDYCLINVYNIDGEIYVAKSLDDAIGLCRSTRLPLHGKEISKIEVLYRDVYVGKEAGL